MKYIAEQHPPGLDHDESFWYVKNEQGRIWCRCMNKEDAESIADRLTRFSHIEHLFNNISPTLKAYLENLPKDF